MTTTADHLPTSPLAYPDFRLYWIARFAAVTATMAMVVIIGWQVYDIARTNYGMTPSQAAFQLGLVGIAQFLPLAILTPVAGWVADRFERRLVARLANSIDMAVAILLGWLTLNAMLTLPLLFLLAALHGVARVFVGPSMSAIAPNLVPAAILPRAIAMSSISWQLASVIGPALGGFLYAAGPSLPYWYSAGAMGVASVAISFIKRIEPPAIKGQSHPFSQMIDGLRYVGRERFLLGAITLDLFAVLLAGATALLPVYARDILHVGPEGLGQLRAAPAFGAVLLALWFSFKPLENDVGLKMLWSVAAFGVVTIIFGLSTYMPLSLLMLFLLGAADMMSVYVRSSLVQLHTPDEMRGRVSAVSGLAISGSNELGEAQSGVAAAILGPVGAVVFGGVGAIIVTLLWARWFPEIRGARTFEPQIKEPAS
ncbi:MAG: MFS transporter [Sphingomonadaceae bacterium]